MTPTMPRLAAEGTLSPERRAAAPPLVPHGSTGSLVGTAGDDTGWLTGAARHRDGRDGPPPVIDLLHHEPAFGVDPSRLAPALEYAFAGGSCAETIAAALDDVEVGPSRWQPAGFAEDLFLEDFVRTCMPVQIDGWRPVLNQRFLVRVLSRPPSLGASVELRRAVLAELVGEPALRRRFEQLYRTLSELCGCFEVTCAASRYEATRHRIDTLRALRRAVDQMMSGFGGAHSALRRIAAAGRQIGHSEGYRQLVALLELDDGLAQVKVDLQLGADGRVRRFRLVEAAERSDNAFHLGPLRRLWQRFRLWWRGYRFSDQELVERWLDHVYGGVSQVLPALIELRGHLEVYLGALAFRDECGRFGLDACLPELVEEGASEVTGLFNPLLFTQGTTPRPCDLGSGRFPVTTVLTGPNSGGKTRLLQALGLLQVLAEAGLCVPAAAARVRRVPGLFASLRDEGRVDQREGHLGTELLRIRRLFESAPAGSLVLLDELCSGTNPSEAEQIITMVLELLGEHRAPAYVTTHFLDLAARLAQGEGAEPVQLRFLQAELDDERCPTYRFTPGVADSSLAAETAARLGVTRDRLDELRRRSESAGDR